MIDYFFIELSTVPFFVHLTAYTLNERSTIPFFVRLDVGE